MTAFAIGLLSSYGCQPKNRGKPAKWMVKIMENPIEMHDFGGTPIFGNTHIVDG